MSISFRASNGLNAGTTSTPAFTLPTGNAADDLLLAVYGGKQYDVVPSSGTFLSGYSSLSAHADGTVVTGSGTGSVRLDVRAKTHSGSESAPTCTLSGTPSISMTSMVAFTKTVSGPWDIISADADDLTATGTTVSSAPGSTMDIKTGDLVIWVCVGQSNFNLSSTTLTVPSCTLGTLNLATGTTSTATGALGMLRVYYAAVTAGTATGAPTLASTSSISGKSGVTAMFVRLREPTTGAPVRTFVRAARLQSLAPRRAASL